MSYSVEIFKDYYAEGPLDTTAALAGVAIVGAYSEKPAAIMSGINGLQITRADSTELMSRKIRWPLKLQADFNIVLTDRNLCNMQKEDTAQDRNTIARIIGESRVAIVNATLPDMVVAQTVSHAMGHLLEVPAKQEAKQSHCEDVACIMFANLESFTVKVPDTSSLPKRLLSTIGMPIKQEKREYVTHSRFCDSCAAKIAQNIGAISSKSAIKRRK